MLFPLANPPKSELRYDTKEGGSGLEKDSSLYHIIRKLDTLVADFPTTYKLIGQDEMLIGQNRAIGRKDYPEN